MTEDERIANALREWLRYETWTLREGLLILTGIDPHHAGCFEFSPDCTSFQAVPSEGELVGIPTWCRIGSPPRLEVDAGGVPHVAGWMFSPDDLMRLWELLEHWHRTPSHDGLTRASPAHFITWSERIDKAPFWLNAVRCAGYMPASMGLFTADQSKQKLPLPNAETIFREVKALKDAKQIKTTAAVAEKYGVSVDTIERRCRDHETASRPACSVFDQSRNTTRKTR